MIPAESRRSGLELRTIGNRVVGHAAVFNSLSEDLGGFREIIRPGAFANVVKSDVRCLFNHDPSLILGRTAAGTLRLAEDRSGLAIECELPQTSYARNLQLSMQRGDVSGMSFSFTVAKDVWSEQLGGVLLREVLLFDQVYDVGPVTFPAYPATDAGLRARPLGQRRRAVRTLAGIRRKQARGLALTADDLELLRQASELLRGLVDAGGDVLDENGDPVDDTGLDDEPDDDGFLDATDELTPDDDPNDPSQAGGRSRPRPGARIRMLRRRLELAARSGSGGRP